MSDLLKQGLPYGSVYTVPSETHTFARSARGWSRNVAALLFATCCDIRWGMCLPTVSVVVLGAAGAAPLVSTFIGVDLNVWWRVLASWP